MILNMLILLQVFIFGIIEKIGNPGEAPSKPIGRPKDYTTWLPFVPKIAFAFEYQVYFMIVYPYLSHTRKAQNGTKLYLATSSFNLVFILLFAVFSMASSQMILHSYGVVELQYKMIGPTTYSIDWCILLSMMIQIPFKFYLGKEFVFIFIDELVNRSISKKIDDLKQCLGNKNKFSETMIQKVHDDLYQIVRMPYMKYSKCQYYSITIAIYAFILAVVLIMSDAYFDNETALNPVQYILTIAAAMFQPLIIYSLSGWLYFRACVEYDLK